MSHTFCSPNASRKKQHSSLPTDRVGWIGAWRPPLCPCNMRYGIGWASPWRLRYEWTRVHLGRWWATSVFWIRSVGQRYHVAMNSHLLQLNPIEKGKMIYNCICFQTQNVHKWCALFNANSTVLASTPSNTNLYLAAPSQADWANDSLTMLHLTRAGTPQKRPHSLQIPISTHVPTESHNALSPKTDCNGTRSRGRSAALQHHGVCVVVRTKGGATAELLFLVEALRSHLSLSSWYFIKVIKSTTTINPKKYTWLLRGAHPKGPFPTILPYDHHHDVPPLDPQRRFHPPGSVVWKWTSVLCKLIYLI